VPHIGHSVAECHVTQQQIFFFFLSLAFGKEIFLNLCRVSWLWHSAKLENWVSASQLMALDKALFAEYGTRQRGKKCYFFDFFCFPSAETKKSHIYQHTTQDISHTHPYSITYTSITHHIHIHHP
jgi:hypothetical protein